LAIWRGTLVPVILTINDCSLNPYRSMTKIIVPKILNIRWEKAVLLAVTVVPILDIRAVEHVPILSPIRIGIAASIGISPCDAIAIRMPIVAELLWKIAVIMRPARIPRNGFLLKVKRKFLKDSLYLSGSSAVFIMVIPRNKSPSPIMVIPIFFVLLLLARKYIKVPIIIIGNASISIILNDTICAVIVVPMFAPIIIPIACLKVMRPAFTNPTVITDVALLLWIIMVVNSPTRTEDQGLLVAALITVFNLLDVTFCRPLLSLFIPKIKSANPPSTSMTRLKYIN